MLLMLFNMVHSTGLNGRYNNDTKTYYNLLGLLLLLSSLLL